MNWAENSLAISAATAGLFSTAETAISSDSPSGATVTRSLTSSPLRWAFGRAEAVRVATSSSEASLRFVACSRTGSVLPLGVSPSIRSSSSALAKSREADAVYSLV